MYCGVKEFLCLWKSQVSTLRVKDRLVSKVIFAYLRTVITRILIIRNIPRIKFHWAVEFRCSSGANVYYMYTLGVQCSTDYINWPGTFRFEYRKFSTTIAVYKTPLLVDWTRTIKLSSQFRSTPVSQKWRGCTLWRLWVWIYNWFSDQHARTIISTPISQKIIAMLVLSNRNENYKLGVVIWIYNRFFGQSGKITLTSFCFYSWKNDEAVLSHSSGAC